MDASPCLFLRRLCSTKYSLCSLVAPVSYWSLPVSCLFLLLYLTSVLSASFILGEPLCIRWSLAFKGHV